MARLINRPRAKRANISNDNNNNNVSDTTPLSPPRNNHNNNNNSGLCIISRQNVSMLMIGMMLGYIVLPVLMVQKLPLDRSSVVSEKYHTKYVQSYNNEKYHNMMEEEEKESYRDNMIEEEQQHHQQAQSPKELKNIRGVGNSATPKTVGAVTTVKTTTTTSGQNKKSTLELLKSRAMFTTNTNAIEKSMKVEQQMLEESAAKRVRENFEVLSQQSIPTSTTPEIFYTRTLPGNKRLKILVTGGAGFVGSHLVDKLMSLGHEVIVLDNFFTGQKRNVEHWLHHPNFSLVTHDVIEPIMLEVDQIYHLACPASPPHYQYNPIKTIKTSTMGTLNMLGLAKRIGAKMLLTSTSEVYGDPQEHPQKETYWGNVNTIGPRSCYDEGKRVAETMMYSYKEQANVEVRVARIFNTFGPRMHPNDGRVVSNFIIQALQGKPLTLYGDGSQTRSFQYVSDLVEGLYSLMNGDYDLPVNLGNPDEYSIKNFADYIKSMINSTSEVTHLPSSQDDPSQRRPDITVAKQKIGWEPKVKVKDGLQKTISYFSKVLEETGEIIPTGPGASKPEA